MEKKSDSTNPPKSTIWPDDTGSFYLTNAIFALLVAAADFGHTTTLVKRVNGDS